MSIRTYLSMTGSAVMMAWLSAAPAHALSSKECGVKYEAARSAGTLNGMKWKAFRKAECGSGAAAAPSATGSAPAIATPAGAAAVPSTAGTASARALSRKECSVKFEAARSAGTLNGMKRKAFGKAECGPGAVAAAPSATTGPTPAIAPSAGAAAVPSATSAAAPATARSHGPVVHSAISIECSKEANAQNLHGKARKSFREKCMRKEAANTGQQ